MRKKKYFGTDGIRGKVGLPPISADWFLKLGWAIGNVISKNHPGSVIIGKDTRISGYMFESALEAGLVASGTDVQLLGPMPTPSIAYLTKTLQADVGIVISASHNSYLDNGIKFFTPEGVKFSDEMEYEIEYYMDKPISTVVPQRLGRARRIVDAAGRYIEFCKSTFPSHINLKNLKIVVDCANGATYYVAPNVFRELGAVVIPIFNTPDGLNINHECGATNTANLSKAVVEHGADVGIALDGDGDRVMMVDHTGQKLDGDDILFLITKWYLLRGIDIGGVVGTIMTNYGVESAFEELQIPFCRTSVGDRHIQAELKNRNWLIGGEPSGHIICRDSHTTGDGLIAALKVLALLVTSGQSLFELRGDLVKVPQVAVNIPADKEVSLEGTAIRNVITTHEKRLEGSGRLLIRKSGTEPLIRVMAEGHNVQLLQDVVDSINAEISAFLIPSETGAEA
jgi:phosphoglucosamine mutase